MKKIDWLNHFLEFIMVVVGILLAFALNNYNESRKERQLAEQYMEGIKQEVAYNLKEVTQKLDYHLDLMRQMREHPDSLILQLKPPRLQNYAWEMAESNTFRVNVEYEDYKKLVEIYRIQEIIEQLSINNSEMMQYLNVIGPLMMLSADLESEYAQHYQKTSKANWYHSFEDLTYFEHLLSKLYKEFLEEKKEE